MKIPITVTLRNKPSIRLSEAEAVETGKIDLRQIKHHKSELTKTIPENQTLVQQFIRLIGFTDLLLAKEGKKHEFRKRQFQNVLNIIKDFPEPITAGAQIKRKGIGEKIISRVDEILRTGTLREIDSQQDGQTKTILELIEIPGIGVKTAMTLMNRYGITSLDHLRQMVNRGEIGEGKYQLTHQMMLGIKYHEDLKYRIPYDEITRIKNRIAESLKRLDPQLKMEVCGSYRRLRPTSGDIDILVNHSDVKTQKDLDLRWMQTIVRQLMSDGIVIDQISMSKLKFMGYCHLDNGRARHIDILFIPSESWAPALLYFTGSGDHNILMRYEAIKQGYTLNEHGLSRLVAGVKEEGEENLINFKTERDIYNFLNIVYLSPSERNF